MRRLGAVVAVSLVAVLATPWVSAAAAAPITVVGGTAFELPADSTKPQTITLPVVVAPKTAGLALRVVDVTQGQSRRPAQLAAVSARYTARPQSIVLTIAANQLTDAATYTVDILATSKGNTPQAITITLTRPAAVIDSVPTVTTSRTRSYLWWVSDSVRDGTITIAETGGKTTLRQISFEQTQDVAGGGTVTVEVPKKSAIPAGGQLTFHVRTSGHFKLGTTTVTMRMRSPQLATPMTFSVSVTQHVSRGWLVAIAAIGALIAWLLNDLVVAMLARGRAKRAAGELKQKMAALLSTYHDPVLRAAVSAEIAKLAAAIDHPGTLPTVVADVQQALTKAQQDYEASRADAAARIDRLRATLAPTPVQPDEIRQVLTTLQEAVTAAKAELDNGKPTQAVSALSAAKTTAATNLAAAVTTWRTGLRPDLESLANDPDVPEPLQVAAGVVLGQLDSSPLNEPEGVEPAELLVAVDHVRDRLVDALDTVHLWRASALAAVAELRRGSTVDVELIGELEEAASNVPVELELATVEQTLHDVVTTVPAVQQAAVAAMLTPLVAVKPLAARHATQATVAARLRTGHYDSAARVVADALPRPPDETLARPLPGLQAFAATGGVSAETLGLVARAMTKRPPTRQVAAFEPALGIVLDIWQSSTALRIRGWIDVTAGRIVQAVLTAVVAVVLVVSLFGPGWVGTCDDLAKVFFWGLTVNLSTGALTKAASTVAPSPSTA